MNTEQLIREEAEKIVDGFRPFAHGDSIKTETTNAIQCAIKHVEGIMDAITELGNNTIYKPTKGRIQSEWIKWNEILNQLKQM